MTTSEQRSTIMTVIDHARSSGARLHKACQQIGITCRTLQRWAHPSALQTGLPATQLAPAVARAFDLPTEAASESPTESPTAPAFTVDSASVPPTSASPVAPSANPCEKPLTPLCADRRHAVIQTIGVIGQHRKRAFDHQL